MTEIVIISGSILMIIGFICLFNDKSELAFFLGVIGSYFLSGGIMMSQESNKPTAMDVYQSKTTLEITYKDGIPVDSVVIYKDKEK